MIWNTPSFEELRMDAEIGSYQEDTGPDQESPIVAPTLSPTAAE